MGRMAGAAVGEEIARIFWPPGLGVMVRLQELAWHLIRLVVEQEFFCSSEKDWSQPCRLQLPPDGGFAFAGRRYCTSHLHLFDMCEQDPAVLGLRQQVWKPPAS